jgi:hypothetical protein
MSPLSLQQLSPTAVCYRKARREKPETIPLQRDDEAVLPIPI